MCAVLCHTLWLCFQALEFLLLLLLHCTMGMEEGFEFWGAGVSCCLLWMQTLIGSRVQALSSGLGSTRPPLVSGPEGPSRLSDPRPWGGYILMAGLSSGHWRYRGEVAVFRGVLDSHQHPHSHVCSRVAARCAMSSQSAVSTTVYK